MTVPFTTPNMGMLLPTVGISMTYVDELIQAFGQANIHDHDTVGKQIDEKSIDWSVYSGNLFGLVAVNSINFTPLTVVPTIYKTLYFFTDSLGTDLFFLDGNGNAVRLTVAGHMNNITAVDGFTGDFKTYNAAVVFALAINTYTFSDSLGLSAINSNSANFSGAGSTTMLSGNFVAAFSASNFTINSVNFFFLGKIICFSNYIMQQQPIASFTRTSSPRLLSTTAQITNQNANFPIRYQLPNAVTDIIPVTLNLPTNLVTVTFAGPSPGGGPQQTFYLPGGISAYTYQSLQDGYQLGISNYARTQANGAGSIFGVTPQYNVPSGTSLGNVDVVQFEVNFPTSVYNSPTFVPRMPQLEIVANVGTGNLNVKFFKEAFIQFTSSVRGWTIGAVYNFQVVLAGTSTITNAYKVIVRI